MELTVRCPQCGYVMSKFDEDAVRINRTMRRAYEHALKNPILCAGCGRWVQRPRVEKVNGCATREL